MKTHDHCDQSRIVVKGLVLIVNFGLIIMLVGMVLDKKVPDGLDNLCSAAMGSLGTILVQQLRQALGRPGDPQPVQVDNRGSDTVPVDTKPNKTER